MNSGLDVAENARHKNGDNIIIVLIAAHAKLKVKTHGLLGLLRIAILDHLVFE